MVESLVEEIKRRVEVENNLGSAARFKPGDLVLVTAGPFRDIEAIFDWSLTPQGRCLVVLRILGRLTRVQIDVEYLAKVTA